jgi:pimeloyl-ACP methyl ester carboxylesterase
MKTDNKLCSARSKDLFIEDNGRRHEPALVFLHGFSFDSRMWRAQLDYFGHHYRVLAYDARGFGRSPQPPDKHWSALDDLDAVLAQASINRAILVAHSMAAITACDYCRQHPECVEAMILVSPSAANYHWPQGFLAQWLAYQELAAVNMEAAKAAWLGSELFTHACADSEVAAQMQAMIDSYSGWHWLTNQSVSTSQLATSALARIELPVLLINGSDDSPVFLDCAGKLAQQFTNSRQLLISDSDHMCNMEQPGVFNRELGDFIAALLPAAPN